MKFVPVAFVSKIADRIKNAVLLLKIEGCVLGGMPRSSLSGLASKRLTKDIQSKLVLTKIKLKKTSPAEIFRGLPGWAENT